ncbi:MAG: hypothetical protein AAFO07_22710, partial [Bacteroidota bacterium]
MQKFDPKVYELIEECRQSKSKRLDLGNLGLTKIPEEVFELTWLEELNFGEDFYFDEEKKAFVKTKNEGEKNQIEAIPTWIGLFKNLSVLSFDSNQIRKIENLSKSSNLKYLELSSNQITKIENLENLTQLSKL